MTRSRQTADWGSRAGLAKVIPSSVAVGSGTGSADSLGTVTFSGASSASLNGIFTSTYDNYFINANFSNFSADSNLVWRMRTSGSDNTNASYNTTLTGLNTSAGADNITVANGTEAYLGRTDVQTNQYWTSNIWISAPKLTNITTLTIQTIGLSNASIYIHHTGGGAFNATTSFDGMTFYPGSGTFSGTIRIYGITQ